MNRENLIKLCLNFNDAAETYPFDKDKYDYAVIRHKKNQKWFALVFYLDEKLYVNLKCKPLEGAILRDMHSEITPAWHMNKTHWIKVDVNKIQKTLLKDLIQNSYDLTL